MQPLEGRRLSSIENSITSFKCILELLRSSLQGGQYQEPSGIVLSGG